MNACITALQQESCHTLEETLYKPFSGLMCPSRGILHSSNLKKGTLVCIDSCVSTATVVM